MGNQYTLCRTGSKTVVVLEGLPGSGKTSLARKFGRIGRTLFPETASEIAGSRIVVSASDDPRLDTYIMCQEVRREERVKLSRSTQILLESSHT